MRSKGRKKRAPTLTGETVTVVRAWLKERRDQPEAPAVPNPARTSAQPRHRWRAPRQARQHRGCRLPVADNQARHPAHAAAHQRDAAPRQGRPTSPPSPCGSGMRAPRPPTSMSTPTPRSRSKRSHAPLRSARNQADTGHPTPSSPSSKPSNYVERVPTLTRAEQAKREPLHITVRRTYIRLRGIRRNGI